MDSNNDNNVFRFNLLRPPRAATPEGGGTSPARARRAAMRRDPVRSSRATARAATSAKPAVTREAARAALGELETLDLAPLVAIDGTGVPVLSRAGQARISTATATTVAALGYAIATTPLADILRGLVKAIGEFNWPGRGKDGGPSNPPTPEPARLQAVGVADLLVVKQQIKRYEAGEVASIENVMSGETRGHVTRTLDRTEEVIDSVQETDREKETEVQSTERYELNRQTSQTQESDRKNGFGLSLSGRYGPSVEFQSKLDVSTSNTQQLSQSVSVDYAKEVVERSKESLIEKVRVERKITILHEIEETLDRGFKNDGPDHRSGLYQFVDKIYETQVFNYGLRQIFDFMIPEPASYLWYLDTLPNPDIEVPAPPPNLAAEARSALDISEANASRLAALYSVQGVRPPPSLFLHRHAHLAQGSGGDDSEEGNPLTRISVDVEIPEGYRLFFARWSGMGTTDDVPTISVSLGTLNDVWRPTSAEQTGLQEGDYKLFRTLDPRPLLGSYSSTTYAADQKLTCEAIAFETATYGIDVDLYLMRTPEAYAKWQYDTFDLIGGGYANALLRYQQDLESYRQKLEQQQAKSVEFSTDPTTNDLMIRAELKKHCLAFIRNQHLGTFSTVHSPDTATTPPQFDIPDALADGEIVRFLEHAFEWDQIQFVFYPYFWARSNLWAARFAAHSPDPAVAEFLKAGSARVVLPVRPGFEKAVAYWMEHGAVAPDDSQVAIENPLYVSIVTEIEERAGAGQGEIAVGDPWETRMPTSLLYLRHADTLPSWKRDPSGAWIWTPAD